jgi:hypothetical protein
LQETVRRESDMNMLLRQKTTVRNVQGDVVQAFNYSTQTLNSTELANEAVRKIMAEVFSFLSILLFAYSICS